MQEAPLGPYDQQQLAEAFQKTNPRNDLNFVIWRQITMNLLQLHHDVLERGVLIT